METEGPRQPSAADVRTNTIALVLLYEELMKLSKAKEKRKKEIHDLAYKVLRNSLIVLALLRLGYLFSQFNVF